MRTIRFTLTSSQGNRSGEVKDNRNFFTGMFLAPATWAPLHQQLGNGSAPRCIWKRTLQFPITEIRQDHCCRAGERGYLCWHAIWFSHEQIPAHMWEVGNCCEGIESSGISILRSWKWKQGNDRRWCFSPLFLFQRGWIELYMKPSSIWIWFISRILLQSDICIQWLINFIIDHYPWLPISFVSCLS